MTSEEEEKNKETKYKEHTTFIFKDITINYDQLEDLFHVMFLIEQDGKEQVTRYTLNSDSFDGFIKKGRYAQETREMYVKKDRTGGYFD